MTPQKQKLIAHSFSNAFEVFDLKLEVSKEEFSIFDKGVYANSMDEKWNIFVLDEILYWTRSWTDACIYKIPIDRQRNCVVLEKAFVTRNKQQYNSNDVEKDKVLFLKLLKIYLGRDDHRDPAYQIDLIQQIITQYEPAHKFKKSISRQSVGLHKLIYQNVQQAGTEFVEKTGWKEFYHKIEKMNNEEEILSLNVHDRETQEGTAYHFDKEAKGLIGIVTCVNL